MENKNHIVIKTLVITAIIIAIGVISHFTQTNLIWIITVPVIITVCILYKLHKIETKLTNIEFILNNLYNSNKDKRDD